MKKQKKGIIMLIKPKLTEEDIKKILKKLGDGDNE